MSEPLITRTDGVATLRGLHLRVSAIQAFADAGYDLAHIRREYPVLDDWTDDDLTTALTYPRVGGTLYRGPLKVEIDDDGEMECVGSFRSRDVSRAVDAIREAHQLVLAWLRACDEWERNHP